MKLVFTKSYEELVQSLVSIGGEWDESQPNKRVLQLDGGIMNWYESTGTIQFQGREDKKAILEAKVKNLLYPGEFPANTPQVVVQESSESEVSNFDSQSEASISEQYLNGYFDCSELIIGIVSAVGTETARVVTPLRDRLIRFGYTVEEIKVSSLLAATSTHNEYDRIRQLMEAGDKLRKEKKNNAILAYGASKLVRESRIKPAQKAAYIINSLKHPDEVEVLRKIYGQGFYLFGIHADKKRRLHYLTNDKGLTSIQASELTSIDEDEKIPHGQRTRDTYHLADFFVNFGKNDDQVKNAIQRFLELIFSHPFKNPTFDEFSMFMAFSSSVRSGDLSRQVGAVIANNQQIMATGANECPASGGGLYWAKVEKNSGEVIDTDAGKDYTRGEDSNKAEQNEIIQEILQGIGNINSVPESAMLEIESELKKSRISDLTEFGRVVHAEMEAIISCARSGISCIGATLYCTTFPCHNCAKHIIAAGISRVIYVEPYPKSKALEFHSDSIELRTRLDDETQSAQVIFEPFTGVGARRFLDFFW
jgi:deoxycytidylate deaminase